MPEKVGNGRDYVLTRGYDIQLVIKDQDYTGEVLTVRVISSVSTPYQIISIDLLVDPQDIFSRNTFSKDPLKLSIRLKGRDEEQPPLEEVNFELLYLKTSTKAAPQVMQPNTSQRDRSVYRIITVCREPFKTITSLVNAIYIGKTVKQIIQDLVSKTSATLDLSATGLNESPIDQVIIPPTTLYKAILYLDEVYGIFNGMLMVSCDFNNVLEVHNLNTELNSSQAFTIHQIPLDIPTDDFNEIKEKCNDGKNFLTYAPLKVDFSGNTKYSLMAKQTKHVVKPGDSLYKVIDKNLNEIISDYGITFKYDKVDTDPITDRVKYYTDHIGFQDNETFINARLAKSLSNILTTSLSVEKSLRILELLSAGQPVFLETKNTQYADIGGKYILKSSDINFSKAGEWFPIANLSLIRTNNIIAQKS